MPESDRDFVKGFVSVLSGDVGGLLIGVMITPFLVRFLGSEQYGAYAFLLSALSVVLVLTNGGISDGLRKFIAEERNSEWVDHVFGFYFRLSLVLGGGAALVIIVGLESGLFDRFLGSGFGVYVLLLAGVVFFRQLFLTGRSTLMGLGLEHRSEPLLIVRKLVFGIVALSLASIGWGVSGVLIGHLSASVLVSVVVLWLVSRRIDLTTLYRPIPDEFPADRLLPFNSKSFLITILMTSLYHVDILLLQPFSGSRVTGYYRAALLVAEFVWFAPFALQMTLLQSTSELWAAGRREQVSKLAGTVTRYTVILTVLLVIGLAVLADSFVTVYFGSAFAQASPIVLVLLPGAFGFAVARPIYAISQGNGDLKGPLVATGTAAILNLLLNLLLIPRFGMVGAAVATSIGYGAMLLFHVLAARQLGVYPLADLRLGKLVATTVVTIPVVWLAAELMTPRLLQLILVPPLGFGVYAIAAVRLSLLDQEELERGIEKLPLSIRTQAQKIVQKFT